MPRARKRKAAQSPRALEPAAHWRAELLRNLEKIIRRASGDAPAARDVLAARRAAKRARAFATMAQDDCAALGEKTARLANRARRSLTAARADDVRDATRERLGLPARHAPAPPWRAPPKLAAELEALARVARDWRTCDAKPPSLDDLLDAVVDCYRAARRRGRKARDADRAALHRWRRVLVDLEYRARLLAPFLPALEHVGAQADALRRALGQAGDIDDFLSWMDARGEADETEVDETEVDEQWRARAHALRDSDIAQARAIASDLLRARARDWAKRVRKSAPPQSD